MAVDFSKQVYLICWDVFARPVTITPLASQPGVPAYQKRGYFDTKEADVLTEDMAVFSDAKMFLDIRLPEFPVLPLQGDYVDIPPMYDVPGGSFIVEDLSGEGNAGGIITLTLKKRAPQIPIDQTVPYPTKP